MKSASLSAAPTPPAAGFIDRFEESRPAGQVIGRRAAGGLLRQGIDAEGVIGIDHGCLRIEPLINEGWGRAGLAYGPYRRENGLTLAVSLTNGHNTAQAGQLGMGFKRRMLEWTHGSYTWPLKTRLRQWLRYPEKQRTIRLWRRWLQSHLRFGKNQQPGIDENLAIGWFPHPLAADPRAEGNAFIVHATNSENGELWARSAGANQPVIRGLQNLPLFYIVVLREQGAAYYAASVPDVPYLPAYPLMRPLAIDAFNQDAEIYAGLQQCAFSQIGFRADTRVREVQVSRIPALSAWYGTAHAADRLQGEGQLTGSIAETGQRWVAPVGQFERTTRGITPLEYENLALIQPETPAGLLHVLAQVGIQAPESLEIIWRNQDGDHYWAWEIGASGSRLLLHLPGETTLIAEQTHPALAPSSTHSLQILDDGAALRCSLDGQPVFAGIHDPRLGNAPGAGLACRGGTDLCFSSFEIHPRTLPVPAAIELHPPWTPSPRRYLVAQDHFSGPAGEISGRSSPCGGFIWQREIGSGVIELNGAGSAAVRATAQQPNPGRTAYTIPWHMPDNADLELEFIPPQRVEGQWEKSRAGLIFYQDENNYITVSTFLDDYSNFASIAFFYHLNGYEEIYDAIWSNLGERITWGKPTAARVVMEGLNMAVYINGEAVLYRSLTDVYARIEHFAIRKAGIVINWEWGNDTGTVLKKFTAAACQPIGDQSTEGRSIGERPRKH